MADLFQQQSPLVDIDLAGPRGGAPRLVERPFLGYLNLRGRPDDTAFLAALLKVLGVEPPREANTVIEAGAQRVFWLGPDEWLIVTPAGAQLALGDALEDALAGVHASVVDNSSGLTSVHVTGANAAALLATDCPLDLHPRAFRPGQCAQTRLARAGMLIAPLADNDGFEIILRRSFADYLLRWLQHAAIPFE